MAGRRHPRRAWGPGKKARSRVAILTEALVLACMVLAVILILRPGADAAHAEADPAWTGSSGDRLEGIGRVIDGDTLDVGAVRVRLHGIDAFERDQ
ncbi:MAG: hypothetical protein U1E18_29775, partial [Brevundimonas sp.]|uniref:hypothetical protein n=1 Tax=Brevundimonas sp. TaxID=1871086 RepID=UPI002ABD06F3